MSSGARGAAVIAVGDELLAGSHPDLNSPEIARALGAVGVAVTSVAVVPDDEQRIAEAVQAGMAEARIVIVTGGLGPTLDDVTRHGIARAVERELFESPRALQGLEVWFAHRGVPMPDTNRRQALLPRGAEMLPNRLGTAPGFLLGEERAIVIALPGPPAEMRVLLSEEVLPRLAALGVARAPLEEARFHLFGLSESVFAEQVGAWMDRDATPRMGCTVKKGVLSIVLRGEAGEGGEEAPLAERAEAVRRLFEPYLFSEEEQRLEQVLGRELIESRTRVAIAESCTGGLVAYLLTRVPGISDVFQDGYVVYGDDTKVRVLGVDAELLRRHGAVSGEVAEAMALGAARASGAELAVAVTGVAGPGGASPEKPVGLVWFATSLRGDVRSEERRFPPGERDWVRTLAARAALFLCLRRLREARREGVLTPD